MTEPRIRYWQQVNRPGCIDYTYDHWPASEDEMEADPRYREVTVTPVVPGDVIEQAARMLHTLQWDGEQEDAESAWDHYPILAVARQEYLRTAEALADAGLLAGSRTVTPEQREVRRGLSAHDREVAVRTLRDLGLSSRPYINPSLPSQVRRLYDADLRERSIRGVLDLAANLIAGYAVVIARAGQIEDGEDRG